MIAELVEKTVGNRRAVQLILLIPFLSKSLFLGAKFRYFNRYNLDQEAADYIRALTSRPRISVALKLHQIMSSFGPLLAEEEETIDNIRKLRQLLITWEPRTSRHAYRKIRTLIKCFDFERARSSLQQFGHLLEDQDYNELDSFFDATKGLIAYFSPYIDQAWENSICFDSQCSDEKSDHLLIFYFPPTLTKLEMGAKHTASFYMHTNECLKLLHESIPRDQYKVEEKLQFGWRTIKESHDNQVVVSYHTKGKAEGNIRIKESAFPNYLTINPSGFSGWHTAADLDDDTLNRFLTNASTAAIEGTFRQLNSELVQSNLSKYAQLESPLNSLTTTGDFFFVALQVANDIVAELAYIETYNLLNCAAEIAERNQIHLVIKRHPKCTSVRIKELLQGLEGHQYVEVSNASIHLIIPACKAVITVNSGVGMEALLHLKDIISTGKAEYSFIAKTARTKSELEHHMLNFSPTAPEKMKEFLHYYATEHLYRFNDQSKIQQFWHDKLKERQQHTS